ncbi:MAG: Aminodeoxychorismate synthase component 1 [Bacteroidota bacterium]
MLKPAYFKIDLSDVRNRVKQLARQYGTYAFFESHGSTVPLTGNRYEFIAMLGVGEEIKCVSNALEQIRPFINQHRSQNNWVFCALSYELKNEIEQLSSRSEEPVPFPLAHCFVPEVVVTIDETGLLCIHSNLQEPKDIFHKIMNGEKCTTYKDPKFHVKKKISRSAYRLAFEKTMSHIKRGDTYELTLCQQAELGFDDCDPISLHEKFSSISPNPFSVIYKSEGKAVVCTSPERFLQCDHERLLSQPMKGTAKRSSNEEEDLKLKNELANSRKERSENVMIVDLVRNDLSKVAQKNSVKVEELFGVHTFPKSHQMISTVTCKLKTGMDFTDIIQAAFPMGSMTGAPKVSSMKIIDQVEDFRRGMFSGSIGFMAPGCYFDMNVVIRTILLDLENKRAALTAGGAITFGSAVESEWEECLTKLRPQLEAVGLKTEDIIER